MRRAASSLAGLDQPREKALASAWLRWPGTPTSADHRARVLMIISIVFWPPAD